MDEIKDVEQLIEAVRRFPCLWQVNLKSYKDQRARENAWKKIAEALGVSYDLCMKKWKSLRDRFVRELRKLKILHSGDEGPPPSSTWAFFEILRFLEPSVRHKPTSTNFFCHQPDPELSELVSLRGNKWFLLSFLLAV
jgi:hypothetical protein